MATANLAAWRALYERALRIKTLAPWTWMEEGEIFGVEDPESKTVAYVSISGALGEHLAVISYLGATSLHRFMALHYGAADSHPERILEIRQIQASFEDRGYLEPEDHEILRSLGLKFRGSHEWPCFRSTYPGCVPWFLDAEEIRVMTTVLEQTEDVVTRVKADRAILRTPEGDRHLLRRYAQTPQGMAWADEIVKFPDPPPLHIPVRLSEEMIQNALRQPLTKDTVEVDLVLLPSGSVFEKKSRPYFPYVLMIVDAGSGVPLSVDLLSPLPSLESMWGKAAETMVERLESLGFMPGVIRTRSEIMAFLLKQLATRVPLKVRKVKNLAHLDARLGELEEAVRRRQ